MHTLSSFIRMHTIESQLAGFSASYTIDKVRASSLQVLAINLPSHEAGCLDEHDYNLVDKENTR